jgi:hypothetical protein
VLLRRHPVKSALHNEEAMAEHDTPDMARRSNVVPRSVLLVVGAVAGLIVVALLVAVAAPAQPTTYTRGTPEAAFQDFYSSWEARDLDAAYAALSDDVRSQLTLAEYRHMDTDMTWAREQGRRVVLLDSRVTGDRAVLDLRIDQFSEGGLGGDRSSWQRSVNLVREQGVWRIDEGLLGVETLLFPAKA